MPIRLGFVGLSQDGWAAWALTTPLLNKPLSEKYTLKAVSTTSPSSATQSADKYSQLTSRTVKPYHGDTSAIANDPDIDMVAVAVKSLSHKQAALPVIEAGKDLFLEWPAGRNLKETIELAEAAEKKGIRSIVGAQGRQSPVIRKLKSIIDSGEIGKVMSTTVSGRPYTDFPSWGPAVAERSAYTADVESGATMLDVAVGHFLESFTFALGDFASVSAVTQNQHPTAQVVDWTGKPTGRTVSQTGVHQVAVSGILTNGAVVSLHWRGGLETRSGKAGTPFIWTIDGEKGSIRIENDDAGGAFTHIREPHLFLNGEEVKTEIEAGFDNLGRNWFEFSKGSEGSYATLKDAVKIHKILEAVARSDAEGRRVDL